MIQNLTAQQQSALTGRHKELHQLWNLFEASMTGRTHVVRQKSTARLLILGAYWAGELASNLALERTLLDLNRARLLTSLTIGPLVEEEIAALAAVRLGLPVEHGLARFLHMHSEGNPFFAEELL